MKTEADLNGLLIYLGLGYPRIEGYEAFFTSFLRVHQLLKIKKRYDVINEFIQNFEKKKFVMY